MAEHVYLCTQRPAAPGAVPKGGLIRIEDGDKRKDGYWSRVAYNRALTDDETRNYELTPEGRKGGTV